MFNKDPLQIITFQSYGTDTHFYMRGRALEDEAINLEQKGLFGLFINSWKRFESDEIKYAELSLKLPNRVLLNVVTDALKAGDQVTLTGFGSFLVRERDARTGRNPRTGEEIQIKASKVPSFKAGKALKDALN